MPNNISSEISNKLSILSSPAIQHIYAAATTTEQAFGTYRLSGWVSDVSSGMTDDEDAWIKAQTSGWYMFDFSIEIQLIDPNTQIFFQTAILRIYKDDINYHELENKDGGTDKNKFTTTFGGSFLVELNAGQHIDLETEVDTTGIYRVNGKCSLVKVS